METPWWWALVMVMVMGTVVALNLGSLRNIWRSLRKGDRSLNDTWDPFGPGPTDERPTDERPPRDEWP